MCAKIAVVETGGNVDYVEAKPEVFDRDFNEALIHQVLVAFQAAGRRGTKAQKTRSEVRGGGAKPWRQKGGGRARAGSTRGPLWRTGGVTFAAKPRSYDQKVNRKMFRGAMQSILSELARQDRIIISDDVEVNVPKTKLLAAKLQSIVPPSVNRTLIVTPQIEESLWLASRNMPGVRVSTVNALDPVSLIGADKIVMTRAAFKQIEGEWQ